MTEHSIQNPGDLSFQAGDVFDLVPSKNDNEDWWTGSHNGRTSIFPSNHVEKMYVIKSNPWRIGIYLTILDILASRLRHTPRHPSHHRIMQHYDISTRRNRLMISRNLHRCNRTTLRPQHQVINTKVHTNHQARLQLSSFSKKRAKRRRVSWASWVGRWVMLLREDSASVPEQVC